jgi:TRAP-type C4-dicarboxylate transport system substrate-binding protein
VGAQPVTVQAADFAQALATNVVESTMTSGATGVDSKLYEHLKYYYDTQAWLPKNAVIVNKAAFGALDKATQDAVLKAAADAEARGWAASRKVNTETLDKLKANGMQVLPPSAQLKTDMQKVGLTMLGEWLDKAGAEGRQLVDAYNK